MCDDKDVHVVNEVFLQDVVLWSCLLLVYMGFPLGMCVCPSRLLFYIFTYSISMSLGSEYYC